MKHLFNPIAAALLGIALMGNAVGQSEPPKAATPSPEVKATARSTWVGTWKEGRGTISTKSGTVKEAPFTFSSRFEGTPGASPEELLAAGLVGCFNQALANNFGMNKLAAQTVDSVVDVVFGYDEDGRPAIKSLHVSVEAKVPGGSEEVFQASAKRASTNCTIARALKLPVGLTAKLLP